MSQPVSKRSPRRFAWLVAAVLAAALTYLAIRHFSGTPGPVDVARRYVIGTAGDVRALQDTTGHHDDSVAALLKNVSGTRRSAPVVVEEANESQGATPDERIVAAKGTAGGHSFSTNLTVRQDAGKWVVTGEWK